MGLASFYEEMTEAERQGQEKQAALIDQAMQYDQAGRDLFEKVAAGGAVPGFTALVKRLIGRLKTPGKLKGRMKMKTNRRK